MKYILILLFTVIATVLKAQDCSQLPKSFNSYSHAIRAVKSSTFQITESANTYSSSWITSADYYSCDGLTGFFIFTTNRGYEYIHKGMPLSVWRGFKSAASKGEYYNENIKDRYQLRLN